MAMTIGNDEGEQVTEVKVTDLRDAEYESGSPNL